MHFYYMYMYHPFIQHAIHLKQVAQTVTITTFLFSVNEWSKVKKQRYLAVPQYYGSGQHKKGTSQYRFLVLQRLSSDLQKIFERNGRSFSEKTTFSVGLRMVSNW
jgi:hypothetical protein